MSLVASLPLSQTVKEFLKSANISQSYERLSSDTFYGPRCSSVYKLDKPICWNLQVLSVFVLRCCKKLYPLVRGRVTRYTTSVRPSVRPSVHLMPTVYLENETRYNV